MKTNFKYDRLANELQQVITNVINEEIDEIEFTTVTDVELTKDLGDIKVYIQCLEQNKEEETIQKLTSSEKFFKKRIAEEVKIRRIPNIIFKYDHSLDNYNKIEKILDES